MGTKSRLGWFGTVAAAILVAACAPAPTDLWQQPDTSLRGHVILAGTPHSSATVLAPADTGGVIMAHSQEFFDPSDPGGWPVDGTARATRLSANGVVLYNVDLGDMAVNAAASAGGRDLYAGWRFEPFSGRPSELVALTRRGQSDPGFGDGGAVTFQRPAQPDHLPWGSQPEAIPESIVVDPAGRIYVAITAFAWEVGSTFFLVDAWVVRLHSDGALDMTYGHDGAEYLGQVGRWGFGERRGVLHLASDGSATVALSAVNSVAVFWADPEGDAARGAVIDAGLSPIESQGWRTNVEATGLHRSDGRTMVVVAPNTRLRDPGVVAIDESALLGIEQGWASHEDLLDQSFGEAGVLAWRVDGSHLQPPMTTPVVAVGGIRSNGDGTFTVPVLTQQGQPGVVSFDGQGRLLRPQVPGGVRVVRTSDAPNLQFGTSAPWSGGQPPWSGGGWVPAPDQVEFRNGALRTAWSDGWHLAGIEYVEAQGLPQRNGLAVLRIRQELR